MCYIACMSKQYNTSEQSEEQQKTRERIITAASKVLAEKGYDATTLREISREAQAAPGLVHYYFGGKDQLLVEALQAAGRHFHQRMQHLVQHVPGDQVVLAWLTQPRHSTWGARTAYTAAGGDWRSHGKGLGEPTEDRRREAFSSRSNDPGCSSALSFRWTGIAKDSRPYVRS